ncbi:MAG TPA: amine dehydrogenase large subunit [Steroidobacteraceae bacterium]|jgi:methylamine dehydrogenase heavy chain|nr:amine dehydrogenase large subunit [Steroidobacteraceae bacterium]
MNKTIARAAYLCIATSTSALAAPPTAGHSAAPPLPAEHLSVATVPPAGPHRIYVLDEAFLNEIDSRVNVFDGDTYRRLGQIDAGFNPGFNLSPDGKTSVVATTYFSRGSRGTRTDVVEFTDNSTLAVTHEIVLPTKRAETLPTYFNVNYSPDSRLMFVSYVTPAASFGVLDPVKGTVLAEIDTAGCVLVIPSGTYRVSSLCESGKLLTVTLDAQGHEVSRAFSDAFFDPDGDPVFVQGIPMNGGYAFLSFLGEVHEVDFSGAAPVAHKAWSLVAPAEKGHWRPGGQQVGAIHRQSNKLYVPMHQGVEGSHKAGGTEIWVFDMQTHQRIARWPMAPLKIEPVTAIQVSQDDAPLMFTASENSDVAVFDARTGHLRHVEKQLGQTPWFIMTP